MEVARALAAGASTSQEFTGYNRDCNWYYDGLTALSLAALVDSDGVEAVLLPFLLSQGGDIGQVDSEGRTLFHFAFAEPVLRYLVEQGAPVPDGARIRIFQALSAPIGVCARRQDVPLAFVDDEGSEPDFTDCLRVGIYPRHPGAAVEPWLSTAELQEVLLPERFEALASLGYFSIPGTLIHEPRLQPGAPALCALLSAEQEIGHALRRRDVSRVKRLIELGGGGGQGRFGRTQYDDEYCLLTPVGLAVLLDGEQNEVLLTPLFESTGIDVEATNHGDEERSLLHLAVGPRICRWLLERGASPDIEDGHGVMPEEMLPEASVDVITEWRLRHTLPAAAADAGQRARL
jgi:hypothetical protein